MNKCNQYLFITSINIINTLIYLIQTVLVKSQIILKITFLNNIYNTKQTTITIHILIISFIPLTITKVRNDTIIIACLVE